MATPRTKTSTTPTFAPEVSADDSDHEVCYQQYEEDEEQQQQQEGMETELQRDATITISLATNTATNTATIALNPKHPQVKEERDAQVDETKTPSASSLRKLVSFISTPSISCTSPSSTQLDENEQQQQQQQQQLQQSHHSTNIVIELMHLTRHRNWKKKVLAAVLTVCSLLVFIDLVWGHFIRSFLTFALEWMTLNPFGAVFSFILFFVVATLLFVPPVLLKFGAGYAFCNSLGSFGWGFLTATAVSFFGLSLGAMVAFLRSRYMMRDMMELFSRRYPIVKALDQALERKGFRVMLLLRLCPIIPFNGLSHIAGITAISFENYTKALIGIVPTICFWTFCGASADLVMMQHQEKYQNQYKENFDDDSPQQLYWILLFSTGVAFGIVAAVCIWRFAIQELQKEIDRDSAETWFRYKKQEHEHDQPPSASQQCGDGDGGAITSCTGTVSFPTPVVSSSTLQQQQHAFSSSTPTTFLESCPKSIRARVVAGLKSILPTTTITSAAADSSDYCCYSAPSSDYYHRHENENDHENDHCGTEMTMMGQEMAVQDYYNHQRQQQQRRRQQQQHDTHGILKLLGLEVAHGLEGRYDEPEDGHDEEWFWLWT